MYQLILKGMFLSLVVFVIGCSDKSKDVVRSTNDLTSDERKHSSHDKGSSSNNSKEDHEHRSNAESNSRESKSKLADEEENKLFLTPGGKYTAEDIQANGSITGSQKFKGLKPTHDVKPQAGEKLCPISMTKANPKFSWIIGGKTYYFCCPPCVDEFVAIAKEKPEKVLDPESYVKK